jgi:hypothetical protein
VNPKKAAAKKSVRMNIVFPAHLAAKLDQIGREVGLDRTNTLKHLVAIYELKAKTT